MKRKKAGSDTEVTPPNKNLPGLTNINNKDPPPQITPTIPSAKETRSETNNNEIDTTTNAESYFSYDVLLHIFNMLDEKRDLAISSGVCKLWRKVALNPVFLWEVVRQWHTEYLQRKSWGKGIKKIRKEKEKSEPEKFCI